MKAIMMATDGLLSGSSKVSVAGGMENMSKTPYILPKAREGYRLGNQIVADHMFLDGLEDAYEPGVLMGEVCRAHRREIQFQPRATGRICHPFTQARAPSDRERCLGPRDRACNHQKPRRRDHSGHR